MSNVIAVESNRDRLYIMGTAGQEWEMTRQQIQDIWQAQTGNPAARKAAAIQAIKDSMIAALGIDAVGETPFFDFDPTDTLASMRLELGV